MNRVIRRTIPIMSGMFLVFYVSGCNKQGAPTGAPAAIPVKAPERPQEPRAIYITVRLQPNVDSAILHYLADVTVPTQEKVAPGTPLKSVLKENYGFDKKNIAQAARDFNSDTVTRSGIILGTSVTLPPGPLITETPIIKPRGNVTVRQLVQSSVGTSGQTTRSSVLARDGNERLQGHWDDRATGKIQLPYATHYTSYRLKTRSLEESQKIVEKLKRMDKNKAVLYAEANYDLTLSPSWKLAGADAINGCSDVKGDQTWPFTSLPKNWSSLDQLGKIRPALVAILDTGLAEGVNSRFPLWENPEPGKPMTLSEFAGLCIDDSYGCNFVQAASEPVDDCTIDKEFHHGTHIAGLVSGRLSPNYSEFDKRLDIMIVKIADSQARIDRAAVLEGTRYALAHGTNVVNLSLAGAELTALDDVIRAAKNTLFVAAAGNPESGVGADLDKAIGDHSVGYPARLAKEDTNLIAVAAHDGSGNIDCFSNYGQNSIDLAAPGFGVNSIVSSAENRPFNGTSQATALVSLGAAILYSQGINSANAIKHRLIASTDFRPALRDKVFSSGILNIEKATAFKRDILQFEDLHVEFGEIISPLRISVDDQANDLSLRGEVYKILPRYSIEPGREIRVIYLREGRLVDGYSSHLGTITFKTDKGLTTIDPQKLIDIIPRQVSGQAQSSRR